MSVSSYGICIEQLLTHRTLPKLHSVTSCYSGLVLSGEGNEGNEDEKKEGKEESPDTVPLAVMCSLAIVLAICASVWICYVWRRKQRESQSL